MEKEAAGMSVDEKRLADNRQVRQTAKMELLPFLRPVRNSTQYSVKCTRQVLD